MSTFTRHILNVTFTYNGVSLSFVIMHHRPICLYANPLREDRRYVLALQLNTHSVKYVEYSLSAEVKRDGHTGEVLPLSFLFFYCWYL